MVMKTTLILLTLSIGIHMCSDAQDIRQKTLNWTSSSNINQADNDTTTYSCSFSTLADQQVNWIQKNGADVSTYTVTSVEGTWPNVNTDGQVTYHVSQGSLAGAIILSKVNGAVSIRM